MIQQVPIEWLWVTGGGQGVAALGDILAVYQAFDQGIDGNGTTYARSLPAVSAGGETREDRVHRLRNAHIRGLDSAPPIKAHLSALGRYEIIDGYHRAAAHVYQLRKTAPVEVVSVSPLFQELAERLEKIYQRKQLYQAIEHPYFDDWAVTRSSERIKLMLDYAKAHNHGPNTMVDVGSCTGAACRAFARAGYSTYGLDNDKNIVWVAEYLDIVLKNRTTYMVTDSLDLLDSGYGWGVVSCLSVYYRDIVMGNQDRAARAYRKMLERADVVFVDNIEPGYASRFKQKAVDIGNPEAFREWLQALSNKHKVEAIGCTEGRTLYGCRRVA